MTLIDALPFPLSAPVNVRDFAGLRTQHGQISSGFALRADDLSIADAVSAQDLVDRHGVTAVIDLRSAEEVSLTGRGPLGLLPVNYHHLPLMTDLSASVDDPRRFLDQASFGSLYVRIVERSAAQLVAALAVIAQSRGTVAFHCAAGQDRTGVLAAMLLLGLDPRSWTRCRFGYAASARVADVVAA
ncbi:tyrosine-protein phosphatase [Microbacterium amylolyticum]|uniref:Protein tyrosine/serine phosphatase n=1 Tax=Microbacterium amylolyticum TaxID=936337 RepID=A0ABS4ZJQ0_9MICO|nr:tyrosine-protein phosphatase [Microbacterium amylolyticum]MBP2437510.1 protein tyrosine/serine phosphatase [Microbacterium amylolyticum]